ncbi:MAG: hypothetical protein GEU79_04755 [Acidimicrobiia bacterium]|nr:hypothetical protein [Acidimicrobiia bacterium]
MSLADLLPLAGTWTLGTALAAAVLAWYQIGSMGLRLLIVVVNLFAVAAMAVSGASPPVLVVSGVGCLAAALLARQPKSAVWAWLVTAAAAVLPALGHGPITILGEALLLGGISVGLCLGHWFLVDPNLPRMPMRLLVGSSLTGLLITAITTVLSSGDTPPLGSITYPVVIASGVLTAVVLVGALRSLEVPTYKGVQSATGLFYVATMTVSAFVVLATTMRLA